MSAERLLGGGWFNPAKPLQEMRGRIDHAASGTAVARAHVAPDWKQR